MARASIAPKHLLLIAVPEALVVTTVIVRVGVLGHADLERPLHLAWMVGTVVLAASGLSLFVLQGARAAGRAGPEGVSAEERRSLLGLPLAVVGLAALLALAGPTLLERLAG